MVKEKKDIKKLANLIVNLLISGQTAPSRKCCCFFWWMENLNRLPPRMKLSQNLLARQK
jgi:hypothetical protein